MSSPRRPEGVFVRRSTRCVSREGEGCDCRPGYQAQVISLRFYCSGTGYVPPLASSLALYPAPTGPQASLAAARITGEEFGKAEARRQAFRRATPSYKDRYTVLLKLERDA